MQHHCDESYESSLGLSSLCVGIATNGFLEVSATDGHHSMVGIKSAPKRITRKHRLKVRSGCWRWLLSQCSKWELEGPVCKARLQFEVGSASGIHLASLWMVAAEGIKKRRESNIMLQKSAEVFDCWIHGANKSSHVAVSELSYRCK